MDKTLGCFNRCTSNALKQPSASPALAVLNPDFDKAPQALYGAAPATYWATPYLAVASFRYTLWPSRQRRPKKRSA